MSLLPFPPNTTSEAIALIDQDSRILHEVIHGTDTAEVLTDNGLIPSVNNVIQDILERVGEGTAADIMLRDNLAATDSDVLVGGVEASSLPKQPLAIAVDIDMPVGRAITVSDRDNYSFEVVTGETPNGFDIIAMSNGNQLKIMPKNNQVSLKSLGAAEDAKGDLIESGTTDDTDVVERAMQLGLKILVANKAMITRGNLLNTSSWYGILNEYISQIVIKPTLNINNPFDCFEQSNIEFKYLGFVGSSVATASGSAGAIRIRNSLQQVKNVRVERCYFENFKHNYWIYAINQSETQKMFQIYIEDCTFLSRTGNDIDPLSIGVPATCVAFQGNIEFQPGRIENVRVNRCTAYGNHMKRGVDVWGNVHGIELKSNTLRNFGAASANNKGNYAIMVYTSRYLSGFTPDYAFDPSAADISGNEIENPRDCGIYLQGLNKSVVSNNRVHGQYNNQQVTLFIGGIVTNGCDQLNVSDNVLWDNWCDLGIAQINYKVAPAGTKISASFSGNQCLSGTDQSVMCNGNFYSGIDGSTGELSTVYFNDNRLKGRFKFVITNVLSNFDLQIKGGSISDSTIGFWSNVASVPTPVNPVVLSIKDVDFKRTSQNGINHVGIDYINATFEANRFDMSGITAQALNINTSKKVSWNYNEFYASSAAGTGRYCVNLTSAEHTSFGNTTKGLASTIKQIGFVAPTWTASEGDRVQSLAASEVGTTPNKYIVTEYIYTNAWKERRTPTGG
jgi:parallel beta-helix repeat protein